MNLWWRALRAQKWLGVSGMSGCIAPSALPEPRSAAWFHPTLHRLSIVTDPLGAFVFGKLVGGRVVW